MEGKLKVLEIIHKLEENVHVYLICCAFGDFIAMSLTGYVHVWLGCNKTRSPEIGTVLHW